MVCKPSNSGYAMSKLKFLFIHVGPDKQWFLSVKCDYIDILLFSFNICFEK